MPGASAEPEAAHARWLTGASSALVALAFVALAWWTWDRWADVQTDFGGEVYVPWQMTEGRALYRDLAYKNGPLSPLVNAALFRLFGVSIRTLTLANLAVLACVCALAWRLLAAACDRLVATVGCLVLLGVFAFGQYTRNASFNWVAPYHHHQTHGIALTLVMLAALVRGVRAPSVASAALAALALGLVFLTKAELFVPAAAAWLLGQVWLLVAHGARGGRALALGAPAALLPPFAAWLVLRADLPGDEAWRGVLGNWAVLLGDGSAVSNRFYVELAGLDAPGRNLLHALLAGGAVLAALALADRAERLLPAGRRGGPPAAAAGALVLAATLALPFELEPWPWLERGLPLLCLASLVGLTAACWRARSDPERLARWAALDLLALWALGLLGKVALQAQVAHYGFALALPAGLLLVAVGGRALPAWRRARGGSGALVRAVSLGAALGAVAYYLSWSANYHRLKDFPLGEGGDRILALRPEYDPRAQGFALALDALRELPADEGTLLVVPEGALLSYWLRRPNPGRFLLFLPPEFAAFGGEQAFVDELAAHPPEHLVLVDRNHAEFGVGPFGLDPENGASIRAWIDARYRRVRRIGSEPFLEQGFGLAILRRRGE